MLNIQILFYRKNIKVRESSSTFPANLYLLYHSVLRDLNPPQRLTPKKQETHPDHNIHNCPLNTDYSRLAVILSTP